MTFLPIVERELVEASRRRSTYAIRLTVAAAGLLFGGWIMVAMKDEPPASLGSALLITVAIGVYLYCLLVGVFRTADCLSEEKREGTLGLLFLTDLKGYDIVLGKLVASSLNAFYGILAVFPVMAIALLVGGVTLAEFWRIVLVSLNLLFFSLAAGMFCSAISRDERRAMVTAFLLVMFFAVGLPIIAGICHEVRLLRPIYEYFLIASPYAAAVGAFDSGMRGLGMEKFLISVAVTHVLAWILLGAASWIVPRTWQDRALSAAQLRRREKWDQMQLGASETRRASRGRLLEVNPFFWVLARHRIKPVAVWLLLGLTALIWGVGLSTSPRDWQHEAAYFFTAATLHTILKWWLVTEAARNLSVQRQSGALELLLSTPIDVKELVRGQIRALEWQFAGPVAVVLMLDVVFLLASQRSSEMVTVWIVLMVVFVLDLVTLAYVGMWRGLNSRHPNRAAASTAVQVLVLPWMIFLGLMTFMAFGGGFRGSDTGMVLIIAGLVIAVVTDAVLLGPAKERLHEHFRRVATERFGGERR